MAQAPAPAPAPQALAPYAVAPQVPYAVPALGPTYAMAPPPQQPGFLRPLAAPQAQAPAPMPPPQQIMVQQGGPPGPPRIVYPHDPDPYRYGWLNDPMYQHARMMPVPMRPQFEGESFVERMGKNMLLSGLEAIGLELTLAIRQAVLPPKKKRE